MTASSTVITSVLEKGILQASGETYSIMHMGPEFLGPTAALQEAVLAELGQDEAHYLVPKSRAQLWHYLHGHHAAIYGITVGTQHAAQLVIRHRADLHEDRRLQAVLPNMNRYLLLQGALSHPQMRGRGLLFRLLDFINRNNPDATIVARIVPDNVVSWHTFMKAGYHIAAAAADPDDERRVFYLRHSTFLEPTQRRWVERHDFALCGDLCRDGWRGLSHTSDNMIEFAR